MKQFSKVLLFCIFVFPCPPACLAHALGKTTESERLRIGIRLYTDVGVPDVQVKVAEEVAARVLQEVGIEPEWRDCIMARSSSRNDTLVCQGTSSGALLFYFVGPLEAHFKWVAQNALGYSIIPDTPEPATMAYVSWPRIRKLSATTSADEAELLGLAMAHEIGHLLLGSHDHANQGIMRAPWKLKDLETKAWEEFHFTRDQAQRLHSAVKARLRADLKEIPQESPVVPFHLIDAFCMGGTRIPSFF